MDNDSLNRVLLDLNNRQFWIVLWGYPERSADQDKQIFDGCVYDEGLYKNVHDMRVGGYSVCPSNKSCQAYLH